MTKERSLYYEDLHSVVLEDAICTAITSGRNGKGCVVLFAAGNTSRNGVDYPASFDSRLLVVGATNPSDKLVIFQAGYIKTRCREEISEISNMRD